MLHFSRFTGPLGTLFLAILFLAACGDDPTAAENQEEENQEVNQETTNQNNQDPNGDTYTVGGAASGVSTSGLVLGLNGEETLAISGNGLFTFETELPDGASYEVTVEETPQLHDCSLQGATGTIDGADINNVVVTCVLETIEGPFLSVSIFEPLSTLNVVEGQTILVEAEVQNLGNATAEQTIRFFIDDEEREVQTVTILEGTFRQLTFAWETAIGDAGTYEIAVLSDDDRADTTAVVTELDTSPFFAVTIDAAASSFDVPAGSPVLVVANVENTGGQDGTRTIELLIDDSVVASSDPLTLAGGQSESITLEWLTTPDDLGPYTGEVRTGDASETFSGEIEAQPPFFTVSIVDSESTLVAEAGDPIIIAAQITNAGAQGTRTVSLTLNGILRDSQDVTLEPDESITVELQWNTSLLTSGGTFNGVVSTGDSSADVTIGIIGDASAPSLTGEVTDSEGTQSFEGVTLHLFESGTDTLVATTTVAADGTYEFLDLAEASYDLLLEAQGLEPNYTITETGEVGRVALILGPGENGKNLTVDWLRETAIYIDGGTFDLTYGNPNETLAVSFPRCLQQPDGTYEPENVDPGDGFEVSFDPDGVCFQVQNVGVDLLTGELTVSTGDILFPSVTLFIDDSDNAINDAVESVEVEFDWIFDGISGSVDFLTGALDVDLSLRILIGGTVNTTFFGLSVDFGARDGRLDCQLTGAWGGDITAPELDTNGDQIGTYLHDPISFSLTTGTTGAPPVSGTIYDSENRFFTVVDTTFRVGRLSQGGDPGGPSCGDLAFAGIDFADVLNDLLSLPAEPGEMLMELELLLP